MSTVLVTGGRGFIGTYVQDVLHARGYDVLVLDRRGTVPGAILGDVRDANTVTDAMAHADGFIHLAGILGTQETIANPRPSAETNIMGGINVLEAAAQYGVHGVNICVGNHWMDNTYSLTKSTVERFANMYREERGVQVTNVRALNAYGPRQGSAHPHGPSKVRKIMPSFVNRALDGQPIEVYGDGSQIMDMIHVQDVAEILVAALENSWEHGACQTVIEAGTGRRTTVVDIAEEVLKNVPAHKGIKHVLMRPGEPEHSIVLGDPTTLCKIGYSEGVQLITLEDGVRETVAWFKDQRKGIAPIRPMGTRSTA